MPPASSRPQPRIHRVKLPPRPETPLPPELVAHQKVSRAVDKLCKNLTVMQQHHLLALLAADIVMRSVLLDAHIPLDERQERAAREYLAWCRTVDRPPVRYRVEHPGDAAARPCGG